MIIREVEYSDAKLLFDWATDPSTRIWAINQSDIEWSNHCEWLQTRLNNTNSSLYIGLVNSIPVGTIRYDYSPLENENIISITVAPDERGKGYGSELVEHTKNLTTIKYPVIAYIKDNNIASQKAFMRCGFIKVSNEIINSVELGKYEYR